MTLDIHGENNSVISLHLGDEIIEMLPEQSVIMRIDGLASEIEKLVAPLPYVDDDHEVRFLFRCDVIPICRPLDLSVQENYNAFGGLRLYYKE